jgi:hypothetical protein
MAILNILRLDGRFNTSLFFQVSPRSNASPYVLHAWHSLTKPFDLGHLVSHFRRDLPKCLVVDNTDS